MTTKAPPVLAVEHLTTRFATRHGEVTVVDDDNRLPKDRSSWQ